MKKEQKQLMMKIPAICKAAEYELSAYGKRFVMNNPNASRVEINKMIAEDLHKLVASIDASKLDELHKEAEAALIQDGRWRGNTTVVTNETKPGAKIKPGWGSAPRGGSRGPTGYSQFQKQCRPMLKAANPEKNGREISSDLGAAWRKMKLHFPNYVERYNSTIDSNPEDDELANAMAKISLVEKTHENNVKKRRTSELRPPRHPPKAKQQRKTREFSKLFNGLNTPDPQPAQLEEEEHTIAEGWGAEAVQEEVEEKELNLHEEEDGALTECSPINPGFMAEKRRKACIPYLETRVKRSPVERDPLPTALCSIDHHIKETMAYCKSARVKVYDHPKVTEQRVSPRLPYSPADPRHNPGYTVAGKTGLYLTKTFYATVNQPTTTMKILNSQDVLTPFPRYTIEITTLDHKSIIVLSCGATLPSAQWPTSQRAPRLPRNHNPECRIWKTITH